MKNLVETHEREEQNQMKNRNMVHMEMIMEEGEYQVEEEDKEMIRKIGKEVNKSVDSV